ncbi:MAG: hypothetical protein EOP52_14020 [Sphingobacteriales bacterium]|nr:MAG: hypothetical protein EOP52_14020 [Sphingobacteriales bacterium]RYG61136.1 MAG: hypothetical protein EON60_04615 [Alphaproteobacteria bacterium]
MVIVFLTRPEDLPVVMRRFGVIYAHIQTFIYGIWAGWQEKLGLIGDAATHDEPRDDKQGRGL